VLSSGGDGAAAYRIVMRREEKKGGLGSKLILNARLQELNAVERLGGKYFRLSRANIVDEPSPAAPAEGSSRSNSSSGGRPVISSYLCKVNQEQDLGRLYGEVAAVLAGLAAAGGDRGGK